MFLCYAIPCPYLCVCPTANFIQKCGSPESANYFICDKKHVHDYIEKMMDNYQVLTAIHHNLYLGATTLRQFRDPRLMVGLREGRNMRAGRSSNTVLEPDMLLHSDRGLRGYSLRALLGHTVGVDVQHPHSCQLAVSTIWPLAQLCLWQCIGQLHG